MQNVDNTDADIRFLPHQIFHCYLILKINISENMLSLLKKLNPVQTLLQGQNNLYEQFMKLIQTQSMLHRK